MGIDASTGLPEGAPNRTPLLDKMKAVAEGTELVLHAMVPITTIEQILLQPANAKKILQGNGHSVSIPLETLPGFRLAEFETSAIHFGHRMIERQADLLANIVGPWADQNGLIYTSEDNHTLSSLRMIFKKK